MGWDGIFNAVLGPELSLDDLNIQHTALCDDSLESLGRFLVANKSLKKLNLAGNTSVTSAGWKSFFFALRGSESRLEDVNLSFTSKIDGSVLPKLMRLLDGATWKVLNIKGSCISPRGWNSLFGMLRRTNIEKIYGYESQFIKGLVLSNMRGLLQDGCLKEANLCDLAPNLSELNILTDILGSPSCRLEKLSFLCIFDGLRELEQTTPLWAELIRESPLTTLSSLYYIPRGGAQIIWQAYENLLCRKDSIDATFSSNHKLHFLDLAFQRYDRSGVTGFSTEDDMPFDIHALLEMNRTSDKFAVARRKVIQVHFSDESSTQKLVDLDVKLKWLPHLLAWIGREKAELSMMYNYLHRMPSLFEGAMPVRNNKRKMSEICTK